MPLLSHRIEVCNTLREQLDALLSSPDYAIEQLVTLTEQYQQYLTEPVDALVNTEQYSLFLQQNLSWLNQLVSRVAAERETVAADMRRIKKGKQAQHSYNENN